MTIASSKSFASQVDPRTREYIDARIREEIAPIRDDITSMRVALLGLREKQQAELGNMAGRLTNMEDLLSLSAARIAQLRKLASEE